MRLFHEEYSGTLRMKHKLTNLSLMAFTTICISYIKHSSGKAQL